MQMKTMCRRAGEWLCGIAFALCVGVVGLLSCLNVFLSAKVETNEQVTYHLISPLSIVALFLLAAALVLFLRFGKRISNNKLFALFAVGYLIAGTMLAFSVTDGIRSDASHVYRAAQEMLNGDFGAFEKGEYLYNYPHQLGLALYDALLGTVSASTRLNFMMNLLLVIATNGFLYRMAARLWQEDPLVSRMTVVLSFAFLPPLFFILFAYGLIPGCAAMCGGLYLLLRFVQGERWRALLGGALLMAIAAFMKKNFAIATVAVVIVLILWAMQKPSWRRALAVLSVVVVCVAFRPLAHAAFTAVTGVPVSDGAPSVLWVAMGTDPDNEELGPGWYNHYNENTFKESQYDAEIASAAGREKLRNNLVRYGKDPKLALRFFGKKLVSIWCEPTFQSIWTGPLELSDQETYTRITHSIYNGGSAYWVIYHGMKALMLIVLFGTLAGLVHERRRPERYLLPCLHLLGGVLFHLAWEGKSQYVYPYILLLIPLCASTVARVARRIG